MSEDKFNNFLKTEQIYTESMVFELDKIRDNLSAKEINYVEIIDRLTWMISSTDATRMLKKQIYYPIE